VRAGRPRTQAVRTFVLLRAGGTPAHPGGAYLCATACGRGARAPRQCVPLCYCMRAGRPRTQAVRSQV